jgi:hypothetical protein
LAFGFSLFIEEKREIEEKIINVKRVAHRHQTFKPLRFAL